MIYEKNQIKKLTHKMKNMELPYLQLVFEDIASLDFVRHDTMEHHRQMPEDVEWTPIQHSDRWGGPFATMWLKGLLDIPADMAERRMALVSDIDAFECLVFIDGVPRGAFNKEGGVTDPNHSIILLRSDEAGKGSKELAIECYAGTPCLGWQPYENYGKMQVDDKDLIRTYNGVKLCAIRDDVLDFVLNLRLLNQMYEQAAERSYEKGQVLATIMAVFQQVHPYPSEVEESIWRPALQQANEVIRVFFDAGTGQTSGEVGLIGHAHLDTAWLWTVEESKRKCARTFSNALALMDWYPEYTFMQSSALHIAWMQENYPSIFQNMKQRIEEGRYEPNGAVWVECDCNITGGESMIRQFLWGQQYTMKEFGYHADTFWLPDTFGYSAAIPQIMENFGVKYFLTTKMAWNESNHFPYDTFVWRGMDNTPVTVHLTRMDTWPDVENINQYYNALSDKHVSTRKLIAYGYGDGGAGPQYQSVELARRSGALQGCPKSEHTTVSQFMDRIAADPRPLPVWSGELYLELHRGTLTMMHDIKRSNRMAENALRDYEVLAYLTGISQDEALHGWWDTLLRNQFHDILPGTCIPEVYERAVPENYSLVDEVQQTMHDMLDQMSSDEAQVSFVNTLGWERTGQVAITGNQCPKGTKTQDVINVQGDSKTYVLVDIPAMGSRSYPISANSIDTESAFQWNDPVLVTPHLQVKFADDGGIASMIHLSSGREICREGAAPLNTFYLAQDVPDNWDNWDVDPDISIKMHQEMRRVSSQVIADGALQFRIENTYQIGLHSTLRQQMIFYSHTAQVDFETVLDWKERHQYLKVGFDVDVLSPVVRNEIQFGFVERPTHSNTSWDAAKTELCNHKWSDLSEANFGVALFNDCKYAMSCEGSHLMLALHKGGGRPDPGADHGIHQFRYALLPHQGACDAVNVVQPAYEFNMQPIVHPGHIDIASMMTKDADNIIIEAVKKAEDGNGYIVRLYECMRSKTLDVQLTFHDADVSVFQANMMEETLCKLPVVNQSVKLNFRPFEIKTLRIVNPAQS